MQEESVEAKTGRLDLVVILQDDTIVNLEMQVRNSDDIISRMTLYNSRLVSQQLKSGSTYEKLKSTISIVFLDYEVPEFAGMMNPIHETIEVFKEDRNRKANKGLQVKYYIELPKCRHIEMDMEEGINQWLAFIDYKDRRLVEMAIAKNTVIREAQSEINRIKKNDNYSRFLDSKFKEEYERACDEYNKARYEKEKAKYEQNKVKYEQNMAKYEQNMAKYEQDKAKYEQNMAKYEQDKAKYEQEKANFENEKELSKRENANLKKEVTKSQKEISKLEKEVDKSHKLGIEEGISEGYSRAEKMKNMQFVESLFSNGFKKEEIVKLAKLSANEVDEILLGLTA